MGYKLDVTDINERKWHGMEQTNSGTESSVGVVLPDNVAALTRHYIELGEGLEKLRQAAVWQPSKGVFMYNLFVRFPRNDQEEHLIIAKGVSRDGPQITFHGGQGLVGALIGLGVRYRMGKMNWRLDDSPPPSYEIYDDYIDKRVAYLAEHGIGV